MEESSMKKMIEEYGLCLVILITGTGIVAFMDTLLIAITGGII